MAETGDEFKVKLTESGTNVRRVVFKVTPDLSENITVNYKSVEPLHAPGTIQVYSNTSSRTFQISSVKLISRTPKEATKNLKTLNLLRGWTRPSFGDSSTISDVHVKNRKDRPKFDAQSRALKEAGADSKEKLEEYNETFGTELLGSPPAVLLISAYSSNNQSAKSISSSNINKIPCVITQLSIPYPSDVDYIQTESGIPFPIIMTIDMSLIETHSPREYNKFKLQDYREGKLPGF